jgi:hypothetical protein
VFTSSPTNEDSFRIALTNFVLGYEVNNPRQAMRAELAIITDLTRLYLEDFVFAEFEGSTFTILDDFITKMETSSYIMGAPIFVEYVATARFNVDTKVFPSQDQLDELLRMAFIGENMLFYESLLDNLSEDNVFYQADVTFGDGPMTRVSTKKSNGSNGVGIAAGVVALTLLAAGLVVYKRRLEDEESEGKDLNNKTPSDITLAGDTYAGETYDGSASVDASSIDEIYRHRDEEEGMKANNLGTIEERVDDASVNPAWGGIPMLEDDADYEEDDTEQEEPLNSTFTNVLNGGTSLNESSNRVIRSTATEDSMASIYTTPKEDTEMHSFEEIALQEPSYQNALDQSGEGDDDASQMSESEVSQFIASGSHEARPENVNEIESLLSYDGGDGNPSSVIDRSFSSSSNSSSSSRRPKTVAEIEAMLSADLDDDENSHLMNDANSINDALESDVLSVLSERPRTVSEIESLLSSGLGDDSSYSTSQSSRVERSESGDSNARLY